MVLHGYFRSTASWRVRIALGLKGLDARHVAHHLRKGEHLAPAFLALNPQGLLPVLEMDDGAVLTQSLAICEYLEEIKPGPSILPGGPVERARIRAAAQIVAADIHPVQNLKILQRLRALGHDDSVVNEWARQTIDEGLAAIVALARPGARFLFGDAPTLAEICLVPQLGNARRFGVQLRWPRLVEVEAACLALPAFVDAAPERQADAE